MPRSTRLWKVVLVVALFSLTSSTAKRSPSTAHARRAQAGGSGSSKAVGRTPEGGRKAGAVYDATQRSGWSSTSYDEDEDDGYFEQQWSDGDSRAEEDADAWDSSYSDDDDDSAAATASLSGDDFDDLIDSQDWDARHAPSSRRRTGRGNADNTRRRGPLSPSSDYDTPSLDSSASSEEEDSLWGDEGHSDASWDAADSPASRGRRGRRPKPSAWTGDDGGSSRISRASRSGRRGGRPGRASQGSVVRYQRGRPAGGSRGFGARMPAVSGAAIAATLRRQMGTAREAVGQAGSLAASTSKRLKREVKLAVSGSWESALLKVTWPDDLPPDEGLVDSLVEAVKAFNLDRDVTKNSAEHRVLLRKLWAKMSEPDWRTVSKAVYLFHTILRDLPREHHDVLRIFLGKMSRERDKKTGCRYFDLNVLCGVNEEGAAFSSFVDRYGTYVFKRAEGFNAKFQELDSMRSEEGWENVVTTLAKAQKAIDLGVACQPEPEEEMELTVLCLRSTADDVCQLWRRFHAALAWVVEEAKHGDLFQGVDSAVVAECLNEFKVFYTSRYDNVVAFLADAEELLGIYDVHSRDLNVPPAHAFDEASGSCDTEDQGDDTDDEDSYDEGSNDGGNDDDDDELTGTQQAKAKGTVAASKRAAAFRASKASGNALNTSGGGDSSGAPDSVKAKATNSAGGDESRGAEQSGSGDGACEAGVVVDGFEAKEPSKEVDGTRERGVEAGGDAEQEDEEDDDEDEDDYDEDEEDEEEDGDNGSGSASREEEEEEEEEEDSAEEGAVDESVDDLTYFDDATQAEGTDGEWESD